MARYIIPKYKMPELQKQIQRIRNKGAQVRFDIINDSIAVPAESLGDNVTIECSEVEVEGRYHIDGWSFVGTIEHARPSNIIRLADYSFAERVPERYRTAGRDCEHCHIRRDRNDTYLVYNEDNDEFKQVGKTCLRGYTNGLDAEACANLASVMHEIELLSHQVENDELDAQYIRQNHAAYIGYPMEKARKQAYKYVQAHGYTAGRTGQDFAIALSNDHGLPEATDSQIEEVTHWLETIEENDYIRNAKAAWTKGQYKTRDAGLITSAVSSFFKWQEREAARIAREQERAAQLASRENTFAGNIGDTVEFTIREVRVAYYRTSGPIYYGGYGSRSEYPVYRILGTDNRIYMWSCSSGIELNVGDTLKGKVKRQITRDNGEMQTEVTRCKVVAQAPTYRGFFR